MDGGRQMKGIQQSLLQGFPEARRPADALSVAADNPIARVLIDSPLPHLDRAFDYVVPVEMEHQAVPGARVKVRFAGKEHAAFITARTDSSDSSARLIPLSKVISSQPVLTAQILELARAVANRYAGCVSDVLRVAVPPRVARVETEFPCGGGPSLAIPPTAPGKPAADPPVSGFARYGHGEDFLRHLGTGRNPRAVLTSLGGYGTAAWPEEVADAVGAVWHAGRGSVVVVPDQRDLLRVEAALERRIGPENFVRLTAEDGPTPRYRSFLRLVHGDVRVAIGTRSAAFAPVRDLGLVCLWDDGDDLHQEQRAPYQHVREVLLLRAELQGCAALVASVSRSTESQRLVESGWAQPLQAHRSAVRTLVPRVIHTADSFHLARDPLANQARIPHAAWAAAREGLTRGPVLLQVARTGYSPALACQDCREPARCSECAGPLAQQGRGAAPACRWCGRPEHAWHCLNCGSARLRGPVSGAMRTAEELGRAFPGAVVISSAGDHVLDSVDDSPRVVVSTPGAEPVAQDGYAAVILLDGNAMLSRESLRAGEDTLRRWFNAAVLARPASEGGVVVITADDDAAAGHLVRWDPPGAASRELTTRQELGLPPAVRFAALTGSAEALDAFMAGIEASRFQRIVGPVPVPPAYGQPVQQPGQQAEGLTRKRILLFFAYRDAANVVEALSGRKAALSAKRTTEPVHVRCDLAGLI